MLYCFSVLPTSEYLGMSEQIRITVEHICDGKIVESNIVLEQSVKQVESIADLGFNHQQQINLLQGCQDNLLKAQSTWLKENISQCPPMW